MEPPDNPSKKETCPGCGNSFKSVQIHITRSKKCNGGTPEQVQKMKNDVASSKKSKRKLRDATPAAKVRKTEEKKRYRQNHKEKVQESLKNYRQSNKKEIQEYNKQYYQSTKSKRAESYQANTKCLKNFFREIQRGPIFPCISCMRCLPSRSVTKLSDKFYQKLCEKDVAKYLCRERKFQIDDKWHLCSTCYSHLNAGNLPSQCQENGLQLAPVPDCLKVSDVGNQLLAKNLVFIKVSKFITIVIKVIMTFNFS